MVVMLSALRTLPTLLPRNIIIVMFLVLSKPQGLSWRGITSDGTRTEYHCLHRRPCGIQSPLCSNNTKLVVSFKDTVRFQIVAGILCSFMSLIYLIMWSWHCFKAFQGLPPAYTCSWFPSWRCDCEDRGSILLWNVRALLSELQFLKIPSIATEWFLFVFYFYLYFLFKHSVTIDGTFKNCSN
jgi:hypothetical protein